MDWFKGNFTGLSLIFHGKITLVSGVDFPLNQSIDILLVGGFSHLEKYESPWEGWHPIYDGKYAGTGKWSSGWWFQPTPLKNDGLRHLGWWHSIPNWMESQSKFHGSSHHQPVMFCFNPIKMRSPWWICIPIIARTCALAVLRCASSSKGVEFSAFSASSKLLEWHQGRPSVMGYVYMYICMYIYICMYVCMYVCILCIYTFGWIMGAWCVFTIGTDDVI